MDLLFYHHRRRRLVVIELKLEDFKPADSAQGELYLRCWIAMSANLARSRRWPSFSAAARSARPWNI